MRTEQEIKDKLLEIYNTREAFKDKTKKEVHSSIELDAAFYLVDRIYTEKIATLNWILNTENGNNIQNS